MIGIEWMTLIVSTTLLVILLVSLVKEKPERAVWWANMESKMDNIITSGDGNRFRKDRMSYASLMEYTQDQTDMFDDETIPCFCGD